MRFLKRSFRYVVAVTFFVSITAHVNARSKSSVSLSRNPGDQEARIRRVEATAVDMSSGENGRPLRLDLQRLMQLYNVPGLSVAVIDNFQIVWAKAYGVIEAGSSAPVTPRTMFQAGSISKRWRRQARSISWNKVSSHSMRT